MPSSALLICRDNVVHPLHLSSSGGHVGCVSCYVLQCICPLLAMFLSLLIVLPLGLAVLVLLLYQVCVVEPGICVVFGSILLRFLSSCCLPLLEGGSRILPRWISGCGGLNLKLYILLRLGLIAMKACAPFLRSVGSSSVVHPFLPEGGLVSFNSCSRARRGYTA